MFALLTLTRTLSRLEEFSLVYSKVLEKSTVPDVLSNTPEGKFSRLLQFPQVTVKSVALLKSKAGKEDKPKQSLQDPLKFVPWLVFI